MAGAAESLQVRHVPRIATPLQRLDMVAFQSASPAAFDTAERIALEYRAADSGPSAGVQVYVVAAHVIVFNPAEQDTTGRLSCFASIDQSCAAYGSFQ